MLTIALLSIRKQWGRKHKIVPAMSIDQANCGSLHPPTWPIGSQSSTGEWSFGDSHSTLATLQVSSICFAVRPLAHQMGGDGSLHLRLIRWHPSDPKEGGTTTTCIRELTTDYDETRRRLAARRPSTPPGPHHVQWAQKPVSCIITVIFN